MDSIVNMTSQIITSITRRGPSMIPTLSPSTHIISQSFDYIFTVRLLQPFSSHYCYYSLLLLICDSYFTHIKLSPLSHSTITMVESVIQLKCSCNEYPWGKQGKDSLSARLCEKTPGYAGKPDEAFKLDESKPYAEM